MTRFRSAITINNSDRSLLCPLFSHPSYIPPPIPFSLSILSFYFFLHPPSSSSISLALHLLYPPLNSYVPPLFPPLPPLPPPTPPPPPPIPPIPPSLTLHLPRRPSETPSSRFSLSKQEFDPDIRTMRPSELGIGIDSQCCRFEAGHAL